MIGIRILIPGGRLPLTSEANGARPLPHVWTVTQVAESVGNVPADQSPDLFSIPVSAAMSTNQTCVSQLTPIQGDTCALTTAWSMTVKTWLRSAGIGANRLSLAMVLTRAGVGRSFWFQRLDMASVLHLNQRLRHLQGARTIHRDQIETIPRPVLGNKERKK